MRDQRFITGLLFAYLFAMINNYCRAEDRVSYRLNGASKPITLIGEIIDYDGRDLTLRSLSGNPQYIAADDVVEVKTHYDDAHREGIEAFQAAKYDEAITKLISAYDREPREWVDREIASWIVRTSLLRNDFRTAFRYFNAIIKSDPYTRHWGVAPLVWSPVNITDDIRKPLRASLLSARADERFLAASILLFDGTSGRLAERELGVLASDPNPRISRLARTQLWRVALANQEVTENILQGWREQIEQLPESMRPGPQYLLGRGYLLIGEQRIAAAEFLKLTIIYTNHEALTARATLEAAEAIEKTGLTQEANILYRELVIRFPTTSEAKIAREKL
ncbi:hypothetical protein N8553_02285 [bacterium]|nr:hypothetical protein [bacterium]